MHAAVSRALFEEQVGRWPPDLASARRWILHEVAYPILDCAFTAPGRTTLRLRFDFSDWDELPPSVKLLDAGGAVLSKLPRNPSGVFNGSAHPTTRRPFLCTAGIREFHTHPSHLKQTWDQFRGKPGFEDVGAIVTKIWHAWCRGTA